MDESAQGRDEEQTEGIVPVNQVYKEAGVDKVEEVSNLHKLTATQ